jgi:hypothetical protein
LEGGGTDHGVAACVWPIEGRSQKIDAIAEVSARSPESFERGTQT